MSDLMKVTPLVKERLKEEEEDISPAPGRIGTHNLQIMRRALYRCATTADLRI